jgi:hypothetical protein
MRGLMFFNTIADWWNQQIKVLKFKLILEDSKTT